MNSEEYADEVNTTEPIPVEETLTELQTKRANLVEKSHDLHEQSGQLDREMENLRVTLDEDRALKQSAVRRLAEKLCDSDCAKIGPLSPKGSVVYERRIRQLKRQLDDDESEMVKRRQIAIDMYGERIAQQDAQLARQDDEIRRLQVKLMTKQRELDDLRLGLEPKSGENCGGTAST